MMVSTLSKALLVSLMGVSLAMVGACGGSSGVGDGGVGAGGTGGGGATGLSKFVGTWHPTSGNTTATCPGYAPSTVSVTENLTWGAGVGADLVQTSGTCVMKANVTSTTAAALPSQTCTMVSGTETDVFSVAAYTFSLSADGLTAMESASGSVVISDSGLTMTCTYSETASYQKIAN